MRQVGVGSSGPAVDVGTDWTDDPLPVARMEGSEDDVAVGLEDKIASPFSELFPVFKLIPRKKNNLIEKKYFEVLCERFFRETEANHTFSSVEK